MQLALQQGEEGTHVGEVVAPVGGVVGGRRWQTPFAPSLDQGLEADEVHGLFEPLTHLHVDAGAEVVRAVGMAEGHAARRQLSIARRPATSGTGMSPKVVKNGSGSQMLSSSSMRS